VVAVGLSKQSFECRTNLKDNVFEGLEIKSFGNEVSKPFRKNKVFSKSLRKARTFVPKPASKACSFLNFPLGKLNKFLLLVLITILVSFSLTFLFYTYYTIQDVQGLDMKMKIGDVVGLDTNESVISFGIIPKKGGSSERHIILENMKNKPLEVYVKKSGEMAEWVYISEDNFILKANETKELLFTAIPSKDAEKGAYKGKVKFIFTRPS